MNTVTQTHQDATWRTDARRDVTGHGSTSVRSDRSPVNGNHRTEPSTTALSTTARSTTARSTNKVNFLAIAPTRRGAPPL